MMYHNETKSLITRITDLKCSIKGGHSSNQISVFTPFVAGGIFSDFELAWTYNTSVLKIFNVADGTVQSSWDFSLVTRDSRTQIRCVIEYPICDSSRLSVKENQSCLIVSYTSKKDASRSSFISFCHPRTSRILHTITTREKVTCMSLIAPRKDHTSPLSGIIKQMSGALAVGTHSGNLLILDIKDIFNCCRRNSFDPKRSRFSEMLILDLKRMSDNEIKDRICKLDDQSSHIAVSLSDKKDTRDSDVEICAITYIPQSTCLAVGLKNGAFQLWDVNTMKKLFKSTPFEVHTPVVGFGFQEPCNDPQNFCYLWVLHESETKNESCLPFAVMYGILYKKVTSIPTYGRHYKNFIHCKKRFDLDVDMERCVSGRCITSSVVSNTPSNMLRHASTNEEDASKINLFVMMFETWERDADINSTISMIVFDMNQWYKAQMPHQCYLGYAVPFVNFMLLDRVSERKGSILHVHIKKDTIQQFLTFNLSEEYSYPSSLSFDTVFLADSKIINVCIPGSQRSVLERIISEGPIGLVNPSKYYTECKEAGLRPCFLDTISNVIVPSQIQQRNYVLTILLENKMSSFLVRCVKEWADGSRGVSGCTLPNLIQWAWDCITRIKQTTDVICIPLFDYSGDDLDRENYQKLKHCVQLIHVIRDLLLYVLKNYCHFLLDDVKLKHQVDTLQLVTKYFDTIIWCLDCSLLPEKVSTSTDKCVPIYIVSIMQYTEQRREELKRVGLSDKYFLIENAPLLIVDAVLESEAKGERLQMQWQRESGGLTSGVYPPVTLQSLLRMFLLPDVSTDVKHFIMMYFLLDVCDYHRDEEMREQLLSFGVIFSLDTAYFSLVQACWFLDHEKFEEAVEILIADTVVSELREHPKLYKTIMQACVCQKQYGMALKLERLVKLSGVVFPDERFYITLLLQNGLVMEAYTTIKNIIFGQKELFRHFFKVCDDLGLLKEIFKFPISASEEDEFMSYLDDCPNRDAADLKIMYLLSRGRYIEAVDVNHNLTSVIPKFNVVGHETTKQNVKTGRTTTRDLLVGAFGKTLPGVTNELITFCRKERDKIYRFKEVTKPVPLSVVVHADTTQQIPTYKSSFETVLGAAISKTAETWSNFPKLSKKHSNVSIIKDTPFLRSDIMTPRKDNCLSLNREKIYLDGVLTEVDEPPTKRRKGLMNQTSDCVNETSDSFLLMSPSVDVIKILSTPHVQKRLNKLLQNTPESSPLASILKSSDISRFKQPQKVGFSMPESSRNSSRKVTVIAETPIRSPKSILKDSEAYKSVKKVIAEDFEPSAQSRADVIVENVAVTQQVKNSSLANTSLDHSGNADSYYSLESDSDINDFTVENCSKQLTTAHSTVSRQQTFIESMSEEEVAEPSKHVIMEVMSEEDSSAENQSRRIVVDVHKEPPLSLLKTDLTDNETSLPPTRSTLTFAEPVSVISAPTSEFQPQIKCTFTVEGNIKSASDNFGSGDSVSFTTMLPVTDNSLFEKPESETLAQPSWQSTDKECLANIDVDQPNDNVFENEKATESMERNVTSKENLCAADTQEELEKESVHDNVSTEGSFRSQPNESVTEIRDSSGDDDSDIEILEDESTSPVKVLRRVDDISTEENDELSEGTYESEYSYSHDSDLDENSVVDAEEDVADEVEDESTEEEKNENEDDRYDVEEEEEEEDDDEGVEEKDVEGHSVLKESAESLKDHSETVFVSENLCLENSSINYDELKKIVSSVAAAEAKTSEVERPNLKLIKSHDMSIITSSFNRSENDISVCEVYDTTPSVIEETVNLDFSDTVVDVATSSCVATANVDETCEKIEDSGNESQKQDTSVEVLSLSSLSKEAFTKTAGAEPPMVFYFGENSVTSIGEDMLIDEPENSRTVSNADGSHQEIRIQNSSCGNVENEKEEVEHQSTVSANVSPMKAGSQNFVAADITQITEENVSPMEIDDGADIQESALQESVYLVDITSEMSIEEKMAENCSLLKESVDGKVEKVNHPRLLSKSKTNLVETSPLAGPDCSEPVPVAGTKTDMPHKVSFAVDSPCPPDDKIMLSPPSQSYDLPVSANSSAVHPSSPLEKLVQTDSVSTASNSLVIAHTSLSNIEANETNEFVEARNLDSLSSSDPADEPVSSRIQYHDNASESVRVLSCSSHSDSPAPVLNTTYDVQCNKEISQSAQVRSSSSFHEGTPRASPKSCTDTDSQPSCGTNQSIYIKGSTSLCIESSSSAYKSLSSEKQVDMDGHDLTNATSSGVLRQSPQKQDIDEASGSLVSSDNCLVKEQSSPKRQSSIYVSPSGPVSSSVSPHTVLEATFSKVSPTISHPSSTHTPVSVSPRSVSAEILSSSPPVSCPPKTPEKPDRLSTQMSSPQSRQVSVSGSLPSTPIQSSPETYDNTYNSHVGRRFLLPGSGSSRVSTPSNSLMVENTVVQSEVTNPPKLEEVLLESDQPLATPSRRRSVRLARRHSTDSNLETIPDDVSEASRSPARSTSRSSLRRSEDQTIVDPRSLDEQMVDEDSDDGASVKSAVSATESVSSRASTVSSRSQTRKRSSFSRLETRKSSVKPNFRQLEVIVSDEEMTSPTKSKLGEARLDVASHKRYATSEAEDVSSSSRHSKRSKSSTAVSDDERLSVTSDASNRGSRRRNSKIKLEANILNAGMLASPTPQKSRVRKLISSTPMKSNDEETAHVASAVAVTDYTMSRRLTRFQKTLLECGIKRVEKSDDVKEDRLRTASAVVLGTVPEETQSVDSETDFPDGSLLLEDDTKLSTQAVKNRPIKSRMSEARSSRRVSSKSSKPVERSSRPVENKLPPADVSSDESVSSRASTSSRRKSRPLTFTKMELRRSSVRPQFKPLSVIPSDEESVAFQTPPRPARSAQDDETLLSSSESTQSKRSTTRRTPSTRSKRAESDHSDLETSSVSGVSGISVSTRRTRRSLAHEMADVAVETEISEKHTPMKKRITKNLKNVVEAPNKEIPKKRKRT